MRFETLRVQGLRSIDDASLSLGSKFNVLVGDNGAGKTSVLEAAFLLSHGRSFRTGARDSMVQRGARSLSVFAQVASGRDVSHRIGLGREHGRWLIRADGEELANLGELLRLCAVVCFEPGSHALIAGGAEERRRFLDWGVFHVEHAFLDLWRRYQRALRQRNTLLRHPGAFDATQCAAWEQEMVSSGEAVDTLRAAYVQRWGETLSAVSQQLLPELGVATVSYRRGWPAEESLGEALLLRRERDRVRGHTTVGVHRCDWTVTFEQAPQREHLSRGQAKLCALSCLLAQAAVFADIRAEWPIICLDDLASELDELHQQRVIEAVGRQDAQVLITGTSHPSALLRSDADVFHVEQGRIRSLL